MKSFRQWLTMLALGAALVFSAQSAKAQPWASSGVPSGFTYQGLFELNGSPVTDANATITITLSNKAGTALWSNTFASVPLTDGIFNMIIGDGGTNPISFTASMSFNEQYDLTAVVTSASTGGAPVTLPATQLWSAPYAINSGTVNGIAASTTPVSGDLFPVPLTSDATQYSGLVKIAPSFLPPITNSLLQTQSIETINSIKPDANDNFLIQGGNGIAITPGANGITISGSNNIGSIASAATELTVQDSETNGNKAFLVRGGIGANNSTGAADGTGLSAGSPQTYWADEISVPAATGTSLQIYNTLVSSTSTIILTPFALSATGVGWLAITSQGAGTFTITSSIPMGTGQRCGDRIELYGG